jgi:hypothetical protein
MSLRAYLATIGLATVLAGATFALVLFRTEPASAGTFGFILFYCSLFFTVCGILSLGGFLVRILLHRTELLSRMVGIAFRQAVLLSVLVVGTLFLRSQHLLSWWNSLFFVVVLSVIEFLFVSLERPKRVASGE